MNVVACVIVTYNRLNLLKECVNSVLNQTQKPHYIIIVNNASTDDTKNYLDTLKQKYFHLIPIHKSTNSGGAGGFYCGIKYAIKKPIDWVWIMDDDCIPQKNALKELLNFPLYSKKEILNQVSFLYSNVHWKNLEPHLASIPQLTESWNQYQHQFPHIFEIKTAMFNSLLINKNIIQKVGLPVKEFFIWYDDYEYTLRLSNKLPGFYNTKSIVNHHTPENKKNNFRYLNKNNLWKYQYGIRNHIAILLCTKKYGIMWSIGALLYHLKNMLSVKKNIFFLPHILFWGLKGFFFNYTKYIHKVKNI